MAHFLQAAVLSPLRGEFCMVGYGNNFHVVVCYDSNPEKQ